MQITAERLRALRVKSKLTQKQLGEKLHVNQTTISSWETGTHEPDLEMIVILCKLYNVTADYLVGLEGEYTTSC